MDFDAKGDVHFNTVRLNLLKRFRLFQEYHALGSIPRLTMYKTKNGFHAIVWKRYSFRDALKELVKTPFIDLRWVAIGIKRGYWFLETPIPIPAPKGIRPNYMKIERALRKENQQLD